MAHKLIKEFEERQVKSTSHLDKKARWTHRDDLKIDQPTEEDKLKTEKMAIDHTWRQERKGS